MWRYINKLLAEVNPNGMSFEILTTDEQRLTVNMKHPLEEPVTGVIEVRGTAQGRTMLMCDSYIMFPAEITALFDKAQFNTAVTLINTIANPWAPS
ncbi:replication protein A 14 kDa subunit-like isoform X2 [Bacillus rossius redtenbacheri]|uniref:replication protein A 14 kDa subunit-like isoform X2 n=1 Tax=Bacillus rossius redtenbacheri TaxID=93214 RepID=UPI002FDE1C93